MRSGLGRRACAQGLLSSLALACARTRGEARPATRPPLRSATPAPSADTARSEAGSLYAAGFRFGPLERRDGRIDRCLRDPGQLHMRAGDGIWAPSLEHVQRHGDLLRPIGPIALLEVGRPVLDLGPLRALTNVQALWLDVRSDELEPWSALPGLTELRLRSSSAVFDLRRLGPLPVLRALVVEGHVGARGDTLALDWLASAPALEHLVVRGSYHGRRFDPRQFPALPRLAVVELEGLVFADLAPFASLPALRGLHLTRSVVRSLRGLERSRSEGLELGLVGTRYPAAELAALTTSRPPISVLGAPDPDAPPPRVAVGTATEGPAGLPAPLYESGFRLAGGVLHAPSGELVAEHRAVLGRLPRIKMLTVLEVIDLSWLPALANVEGLFLGCHGADLSPLRALPELSRLVITGVVADPASLPPLPLLRELDMRAYVGPNGAVARLDWLRPLVGLTSFGLASGSGRTLDLTALVDMPRLTRVALDDFELADLRPLGEMPALRSLRLERCEVASFATLARLRGSTLDLDMKETRYAPDDLADARRRLPGLRVDCAGAITCAGTRP